VVNDSERTCQPGRVHELSTILIVVVLIGFVSYICLAIYFCF